MTTTLPKTITDQLAHLPYTQEKNPRSYHACLQVLGNLDTEGPGGTMTRPQAEVAITYTGLTPKTADNIILRLHARRYITITKNGPGNTPRHLHTIGQGARFPHSISDHL